MLDAIQHRDLEPSHCIIDARGRAVEAAFIAAHDAAVDLDSAPMATHAAHDLASVVGHEQARPEVGPSFRT